MSTAIQMERLGSSPLHTRANTLPLDQMEQGQEQNMRPSEERDSASQEYVYLFYTGNIIYMVIQAAGDGHRLAPAQHNCDSGCRLI